MTNLPPTPLLMLWSTWIVQAVLSALQVRKFVRRFERKQRGQYDTFAPPVAVIVPFKGAETSLEAHVRGLCQQDYGDYELLLVVDSVQDPAYRMLLDELARYPHLKAQVLVAGPAQSHEGQKVHNQLYAIDHLLNGERQAHIRASVWVFADSDAVPGSRWLADLVGPLRKSQTTGVTTGYRWLIPTVVNGQNPTIWAHLASVINSSVACAYGHDAFNHAWGGSMAVRAETAHRGSLRERLTGALCDDYQFSRMSRDLGLRVYFIPWCLVATPVNFDLSGLINFAHRQYLLTRVYAPKLFAAALAMTSLYVAGWISVWCYLLVAMGENGAWWWPAGVIVAVFIANQIRATYRRQAVERGLGSDVSAKLRLTLCLDRWATSLWMTLHWLLILRAAFGRTMRWRGISYRLLAPQRVEKLDA